MSASAEVSVPEHIRPDQIYPFDIYQDPRLLRDVHLGYREMAQEAPEIFYTPKNGGHWLVTSYDLVEKVVRDAANFSNREIEIPKTESPFVAIPINLDPPEHTPYRRMLMKHFTPRVIARLEDAMQEWSERLIAKVQIDGRCDFAAALGAVYPVTIFMEMAGLPLDRYT